MINPFCLSVELINGFVGDLFIITVFADNRGDTSGVLAGETSLAETVYSGVGELVEIIYIEESEGVNIENLRDLFHAVTACNEVFLCADVSSVVAEIDVRRSGGSHVNFLGAGFTEKFDGSRTGSTSYDGVVNKDYALVLYNFGNYIQLDAYQVFAVGLTGSDEGSADILVLEEAHFIGNAGFVRITDGCVDTGVGCTDYDVGFNGMLDGEESACTDSCSVYRESVNDGVGTRGVKIFKYAEGVLAFAYMILDGANAVCFEYDNFAGFNVADEFAADGSDCTGFGSNDVAAVLELTVAERSDTVDVTAGDELSRRHDYDGICACKLIHSAGNAFFDGRSEKTFSDDNIGDDFSVAGGVEYRTGKFESFSGFDAVDESAVEAEREVALYMADYHGLSIEHMVFAGLTVSAVTDRNIAVAEFSYIVMVEDFVHKTRIFAGSEHSVIVYNNTAAFLTSVLERVETVVYSGSHVGFCGAENTEYTAFFFDVFHGNTSL